MRQIMRPLSRYLTVVPLLILLSGCQKKFSDTRIEIAEEKDDRYGSRAVTVFAPKDSSVEEFKQWSKDIKQYEASDKPVDVGFFPIETHSSYYTDIIAQYVQKRNWLWVKGKNSIAGVPVD